MKYFWNIPWSRVLAEGVIIVVSILLAFWIEASWEEKQLRKRGEEAVAALRSDFDLNVEVAIQRQEEIQQHLDLLNIFLELQNGTQEAPLEELYRSFAPILNHYNYTPALAAYESAVDSEVFGLVTSPELNAALSEFMWQIEEYKNYVHIYREIYYLGEVYEIRQKVGTFDALSLETDGVPAYLLLTEPEIREFFASQEVIALILSMRVLKRNKLSTLRVIEVSSRQVLAALRN